MKNKSIYLMSLLVLIALLISNCSVPPATEVEPAAPVVEEDEPSEPSQSEAEPEIVVPSKEEGYAGPPLTI